MLFSTFPAGTLPGQRMIVGTRKPPSYTVPFVARNGVMPPSGQVNTLGAVVGGEDDDGVVGNAKIVERLHEFADRVVDLRHAGFFETVVRLGVHHRLVLFGEEA